MLVMLQPASLKTSSVARHYEDTIHNHVDLAAHADLLNGGDLALLLRLYPSGAAPLWGVTPGTNNVNVGRIRKLRRGDYVFFYGDHHLYLGGLVTHTFHNEALAERLWGRDHKEQTWEYMYALDEVRGCQIPIAEVREALPTVTSPRWFVQNPTVVDGIGADNLINLAQLDISAAPPIGSGEPPTDDAVDIPSFTGELEREALRAARGEQERLKRHLLPGQTGVCALCGRTLDRGLLVAAHIKKRMHCSDDERRDLANVAMLNCILGCDALYENGYISVGTGGEILTSGAAVTGPGVTEHVNMFLKGRTTSWWTQEREKYFAWHRTRTFKADIPS
ncbi:hypothetical protein [Nonomuraea zeae]|uniref:C2H2-type domain-containing protein n=1 Tax=Nonomuraea zeae TaxID=1642303 RepID=A0A5S4H388_9ACTN|nr:hypothetical protein [Nonomuraea zeae]TMR39566.1 hypothetical protein ETD85_00710 [Nonomuraea zeae]